MGRHKDSKNKTPEQREQERLNKNPVGRPSKISEVDLEQVEKLAQFGRLDLEDIAYILGIDNNTLHVWKKRYPKFRDALKRGRARAIMYLKQKAYERAIGYTHREEKIFVTKREPTEDNPKEVNITRVETDKHYPPDPTAFIFLLCNWQKDEFKRDWQAQEGAVDRIEELKAIAEILDKRNKKK